MQEGQQWCTYLPRAVSGGLMCKATELPGGTSLGLYLFIATATRLVGQTAIAGMLSVSALLQCRGRTDGNLLCPKHSPGTGESRGDSGCLPDGQEPATAEATHGPDTGMLPAYLSTAHHLQPFSVRPAQGSSSKGKPVSPQTHPSPRCPKQNKPRETVRTARAEPCHQ